MIAAVTLAATAAAIITVDAASAEETVLAAEAVHLHGYCLHYFSLEDANI